MRYYALPYVPGPLDSLVTGYYLWMRTARDAPAPYIT